MNQHVGQARPTEHQVAALATLDQHVGRTGTVEMDVAFGHVGLDDVAATGAVKEDVTLALAAALLARQQRLAGELAGGRQSIRHGSNGIKLVAHLAQGVAPVPMAVKPVCSEMTLSASPARWLPSLYQALARYLSAPVSRSLASSTTTILV